MSGKLHDLAFEALPEGLLAVDGDGRVQTVNAAAAAMLGVVPERLMGHRLFDVVGALPAFTRLVELVETGLKASAVIELAGGRRILAMIRSFGGGKPGRSGGTLVVLHDLEVLDHERERAAHGGRSSFKLVSQRHAKPDLERQRRISPYLNHLVTLGERAMKQGARVLLLGESGAGKTEIARYLHSYVSQPAAAFIHVNCGSIPDTLFESEMFGYERGAFTGALSGGKKGLIEAADGGTLFLDEVGEIPLAMQAKLLKFLETGTVQKVGGSAEKAVRVRVLAATNRMLEDMVKDGLFRRDLYYRLAVVPLKVRSLADTPELIDDLIDYFITAQNQRRERPLTLTPDCRSRLAAYSFPGNIRELQNIIQQVSVVAAEVADASHLPEAVLMEASHGNVGVMDDGDLKSQVRAYERRLIDAAIGKLGSKRKAAEALGVDIGTIVRKTQAKH
ncbi:MAG: sigma 54-interacting transcriptional regulator [Alphaproteobacteria bacterium]|nr:sigma 54-interacting transcriptional regulator [Alphaproteobacteria bacterium]